MIIALDTLDERGNYELLLDDLLCEAGKRDESFTMRGWRPWLFLGILYYRADQSCREVCSLLCSDLDLTCEGKTHGFRVSGGRGKNEYLDSFIWKQATANAGCDMYKLSGVEVSGLDHGGGRAPRDYPFTTSHLSNFLYFPGKK